MATPISLFRPVAGERIDPTSIDATGATLGDVLTAVSDGSGGKRAGYAAPSGGGAVSSVFGRTGAVVAAASDYTIAQIAGLASVAANTILAGPTSGGSAAAAMRALVAADIPSLDAAKITTGVFPIARLATGTPDGTKFIRDDGTLVTPSGSSTVQVRKNSTGSTYTRPRINFIEGSNVTLTVADDGTDNEVDVTIAASGSGSAGALALLGTYTASGASSLSVASRNASGTSGDVFQSDYENYVAQFTQFTVSNDAATLRIRALVAGTADTSNAYTYTHLHSVTGGIGGAGGGDTTLVSGILFPALTNVSGYSISCTIAIDGPLSSLFKAFASSVMRIRFSSGDARRIGSWIHAYYESTNAMSGLDIGISAGTFSGKLRIYGVAM